VPGHNPAEEFLDEEFPVTLRHLLPSALRRAYAAASRVVETVRFLGTPAGRHQRGDLIALASEYEVERLVLSGDLPFDCSWEPYARPTGVHLVLRTSRAKLTVSQVEDGAKKPRHAVFRQNYGISNKRYLFDFMNKEMEDARALRHLLLLHGYQRLDFAYLAVPDARRKKHIARSTNLLLLPHVATDETKEEGPTESPEPEAIERLLRVIRDTDGNND
jgi:hypothetical protein